MSLNLWTLASSILQILLHILVSSYYILSLCHIFLLGAYILNVHVAPLSDVLGNLPLVFDLLLPPSLSFHDLPLKVTIFMCHCVWYHQIIPKNS